MAEPLNLTTLKDGGFSTSNKFGMGEKKYINYGCGLTAPKEWENFDISPTLRIQKTPILGSLMKNRLNAVFPSNVRYGNIIKGLPVKDDSCDGAYCSHTLEHLSLSDFRTALRNTYKILKRDGIFRCVVPDIEWAARKYIAELDNGKKDASHDFMTTTLLGVENRPRGFKGLMTAILGNSNHLWMWDNKSLAEELQNAGFRNIRDCNYGDCKDQMFNSVEDKSRFINAVAIECQK